MSSASQSNEENKPLLGSSQPNIPKAHGLTFAAAVFNIINTIIGSGFLTFPYNLKLDGYVNGLIIMFLTAIGGCISAFLLVDVSDQTGCYTYKMIAQKLLKSEVWGYILTIISIIDTFGTLTSYAIVIQDNFFFFDEDDKLDKQLLFWPIMLLLILPLACFQNLDKLHYCSYVTLFVVCYIAIVSISYFSEPDRQIPPEPIPFQWTADCFSTIPLFQTAWDFHYQIGNIYRDLNEKHGKNMHFAIAVGMLIPLFLFVIIAVFGYFEFTDLLHSDLLKAFSYVVGNVWYVKTANVLMCCALIAHYPLTCFAMRRMIESCFWGDNDAPKKWRITIATLTVVICSLCGSFISEISTVLGFTSSISGSCVVFLFPGLFELLTGMQYGGTNRKVLGIIFILLGLFILVSGLTMQFVML